MAAKKKRKPARKPKPGTVAHTMSSIQKRNKALCDSGGGSYNMTTGKCK